MDFNNEVCGIVLKVPYEKMGSSADISVLGRTMLEWVGLALDNDYTAVDFNPGIEIPQLVKNSIDKTKKYTVVLFSDTPLITKKTVLDALATLHAKQMNVLAMTRGFVFCTDYLLKADKIYMQAPLYFEQEDFLTAFSYKQIALISDILKQRILDYHAQNGVMFEDMNSTFIDSTVTIARGTTIAPFNVLKGKTVIKENVRLNVSNYIEDSIIEANCRIDSSRIYHSFIGADTTVGPYAYIRPDSIIGAGCRIGDFVEIKKSVISDGCKVSHLSYVGDAEIGRECNIGCGVVFVNYDGKDKAKAIIGNRVFIGSNSNLIAPITIEDNAYVAAGSTLTDNVPKDALAIARQRQIVKQNWQGNKFKKQDND